MQKYYTETIDTEKQKDIVNAVTYLVFESNDKEQVRNIIFSLVDSLIGGFNAYKDIDSYLDKDRTSLKKYWEDAQKAVFSGGNAGWSMCVKEMLEIMSKEIENLKDE